MIWLLKSFVLLCIWEYAWKVAESTLKKFIRTEQIMKNHVDYSADDMSVYEVTPEQEYIERETHDEQIYLLRRELSLLSKIHRMEVSNPECSAWFSAENYSIIERAQRYEHTQFSKKAEAMCDAILVRTPNRDNETLPWLIENKFITSDGKCLQANFPVFGTDCYNKICQIIRDSGEIIADFMITVSDHAAEILSEHAPKGVKNQCGTIAKIHHRMAVAAMLMESLIENERLFIPDEKIPLCVWGVRK